MSSLSKLVFLIFMFSFLMPTLLQAEGKSKPSVSSKKANVEKEKPKHIACPGTINEKAARDLIDTWMQAEFSGLTRPQLAKASCLKKPTRYKLPLPKLVNEPQSTQVDFYASNYKVLSLKKGDVSQLSHEYKAKIQVTGTQNGKSTTIEKDVIFTFPRGLEAKAYGCVLLHSEWGKNFISKSCAQ